MLFCKTPYMFLMDSDTIITSPQLLPKLAKVLDANPEAYGCGRVLRTLPNLGGVPYLAPWFALVRRSVWKMWPRFKNSIAPCLEPMKALASNRKSKLLIDVEGLTPEQGREYQFRNTLLKDMAIHAVQVTVQTVVKADKEKKA
jgi:hypothetical protein